MACFSVSNKPRSTGFKVFKWIVMMFFVNWHFYPIRGVINLMKQIYSHEATIFEYLLIGLIAFVCVTLALCFIFVIIGVYFENEFTSVFVAIVSIVMFIFSILMVFLDTSYSSNQIIDNLCRSGVTLVINY